MMMSGTWLQPLQYACLSQQPHISALFTTISRQAALAFAAAAL
jgi:hypothetical protein